MPRKKTFQTFREARKIGAYAERPMLPDETHIQVHLSRNDRPQPFYLICEKDTMLLAMSGTGRVQFKEASVRDFPLAPGDCVYVPAGAPHRLVPDGESVILRYLPREPGLEGVAWYCEACETALWRHVWDSSGAVAQTQFHTAVETFNGSADHRTCSRCGTLHPTIDPAPFAWPALAEELAAER
jgi:3-hydroxyanthranilate 3,4-dioxygenase